MAMIHMNRFSALDAKFEVLTNEKGVEKQKQAKSVAFLVATITSASDCADSRCSRCCRAGHFAKDCKLPFIRDFTRAEMRIKQEVTKAQKIAGIEAQRVENEQRQAAWAKRQEKRAELSKKKANADKPAKRDARVPQEWDAESDISLASTATSATSTLTPEQGLEVRVLVAKDKEVRRLEKLLREIAKLEQSADLDVLQQKKVDRKSELELTLESTRGLAAARARNQVRQQGVHLNQMD